MVVIDPGSIILFLIIFQILKILQMSFNVFVENILICSVNQEPLYDERLSWEGRSDKMVQVGTKNKCCLLIIKVEI